MRATRLRDGRIRIPVYLDTKDGGKIHSTADVGPDDPRYAAYDEWLRQESTGDALRAGVV